MTVLLLVGAGHAHLHVVTRADDLRAAGYRVCLLAPATFHYSGTASATAAGSLPADVGAVDVRRLARAHGVDLVEAYLVDADLDGRVVTTSDGDRIGYDVLSLNLGSVVAPVGGDAPGVVPVKPLAALTELDHRLRAAEPAVVTVVGAGTTGVEMAAQLSSRGDVALVRLVEAGGHLAPALPPRARERVERVLAARGVEIVVGRPVASVGAGQVRLDDGTSMPHDVAVLATGLLAPPLVAELGLGTDRGVPVRATLQHADRDDVYAVGDCAHFLPRPLPRVGVHGVRQAPVLVRSLLARAGGGELPVYRPQRHALAVLDLGDGVGLAVRGRWWWYGALALRLKRRLDRRWLSRYQ